MLLSEDQRIDVMAKALHRLETGLPGVWQTDTKETRDRYRKLASAALEALCESDEIAAMALSSETFMTVTDASGEEWGPTPAGWWGARGSGLLSWDLLVSNYGPVTVVLK